MAPLVLSLEGGGQVPRCWSLVHRPDPEALSRLRQTLGASHLHCGGPGRTRDSGGQGRVGAAFGGVCKFPGHRALVDPMCVLPLLCFLQEALPISPVRKQAPPIWRDSPVLHENGDFQEPEEKSGCSGSLSALQCDFGPLFPQVWNPRPDCLVSVSEEGNSHFGHFRDSERDRLTGNPEGL